MPQIVWLVAGGALLLIEMWTADLLFASLGVSALLAGASALAGADWLLSSIVFAASAMITLLLLRPLGLRVLRRNADDSATNIDALIGAEGVATSDITGDSGNIKLRGEHWSAITEGDPIPDGTRVTLTRVNGATAVVVRKEGD